MSDENFEAVCEGVKKSFEEKFLDDEFSFGRAWIYKAVKEGVKAAFEEAIYDGVIDMSNKKQNRKL